MKYFQAGAFSNEPTPVESSRKFSGNDSPVKAAGVFGSETKPDYSSTPQPPGSSVPPIPPITEENILYVPNTLEGQITLDNLEFLSEYNDHNSTVYKSLTRELEENIKATLSRNSNEEIYVKVMNLK